MVEVATSRVIAARSQRQPAPGPKCKAKGPKQGLTAISEAAEWTEEYSMGHSEEVDALWAEAGFIADVEAKPQGAPSAAKTAAAALAAASAARKGGLGGLLPVSGRLPGAMPAMPGQVSAAAKVQHANVTMAKDSSSEETSDEEVETQHVSIEPRSCATEVVELDFGEEVKPKPKPSAPSCRPGVRLQATPTKGAQDRVNISMGRPGSNLPVPKSREPVHPVVKDLGASPKSPLKNMVVLRQRDPPAQEQVAATSETSGEDQELEEEWAEIGRRSEELAKQAREGKGKVVEKPQDVLGQAVSYHEVHMWLSKEFADGNSTDQDPKELDKESVLRMKATQFDFNDAMHHRMLRTMYCKLARCKVCPRVGSHWEVLGFQGADPVTDLNRSGGLLNVIQMFFFFAHYFDIFKAAYHLSQDVEQNFPLAAVCINITKMVMDALQTGHLANLEAPDVFHVANRAFCGGLHHFYYQWRTQKRTIRDSEMTFKEVQSSLRTRPEQLLEALEKAMAQRKQRAEVESIDFTDLGQLADEAPSQEAG